MEDDCKANTKTKGKCFLLEVILEFLRNATALKIAQQSNRYRGLEIRNTKENGWSSHSSLSGTDKWHSIKALHLVVCCGINHIVLRICYIECIDSALFTVRLWLTVVWCRAGTACRGLIVSRNGLMCAVSENKIKPWGCELQKTKITSLKMLNHCRRKLQRTARLGDYIFQALVIMWNAF